MNYKKITENIFLPETSTPEPLYLDKIEQELAALQQQQTEPTEAQLIEFGKMMHPYYAEANMQAQRIIELVALLNELKAL